MMFVALLQDVGFSPLLTQRRGQAIVYLHDSTQIEVCSPSWAVRSPPWRS